MTAKDVLDAIGDALRAEFPTEDFNLLHGPGNELTVYFGKQCFNIRVEEVPTA